MDTLFGGQNWKTSVLSLFVSVALYFQQIGVAWPTTAQEWGSALVSALIFAWGRMTKDSDTTGAGATAVKTP